MAISSCTRRRLDQNSKTIIFSIFLPTYQPTHLPSYLPREQPLSRGPSCQLRPNRASGTIISHAKPDRENWNASCERFWRARRCRSGLFSLLPASLLPCPASLRLSQDLSLDHSLSLSLCLSLSVPP